MYVTHEKIVQDAFQLKEHVAAMTMIYVPGRRDLEYTDKLCVTTQFINHYLPYRDHGQFARSI